MKVSGNRALAAAYVDSRAVQDRLAEVLGVDGCQSTNSSMFWRRVTTGWWANS